MLFFNAYYEIIGVKINYLFILYIYIPSSKININIYSIENQFILNKSNKIYIFI